MLRFPGLAEERGRYRVCIGAREFSDRRATIYEYWKERGIGDAGYYARYAIDPSRIREELGWRPSVTLDQGLEKTVQWFLDHEDWWRALQDRDGVGKRLGTA